MVDKTGEQRVHFVYIVRCSDDSLYTGCSTNVERRVATHNAGKGARYTRARLPICLCAVWGFPSKGDALRAEWAIKGLPRAKKAQLVEQASREGETSIDDPCICLSSVIKTPALSNL